MKLNKKQKRTATIASMAALLAVVLGMGGQTFAKYITTTSAEADQVTVAKWGVVVNVTGTGTNSKSAFSSSYDNAAANTVVKSSSEVVAPGTSGSFTVTITGKPEVDAYVDFNLVVNNEVHLDSYYPIEWTIQKNSETATKYNTNHDTSATALTGGIITGINGCDFGYDAADDDAVLASTYTITWSWPFGTEGNSISGNDVSDTKIADLKAMTKDEYTKKYGSYPAEDTYDLFLDLDLTVTVYQTK